MLRNDPLPYRKAFIVLGGYGTLLTGITWMFVGTPEWSFIVGVVIAFSFPMMRVSPDSRIGGRRRHGSVLGIGLAATLLAAVLAGATVAKTMSSSNPDADSAGQEVVACIMIFAFTMNTLSAIAHVVALMGVDDSPAGEHAPRRCSDEIEFLVTWLALPCFLVAAAWSMVTVANNPLAAPLSAWLVTVFVALTIASHASNDAIAGLQSLWSNTLTLALALLILTAGCAVLAAQSSRQADAAAWLSLIVGLAALIVTARATSRTWRQRSRPDAGA